MNPTVMRQIQGQVAAECTTLLAAGRRGQAVMKTIIAKETSPDSHEFWQSCKDVVVAAGNIHKALWGSGGKQSTEREPLRKSLGVKDDSPLQDALLIRNDFEHLDERLSTWGDNPDHHVLVDRMIGPIEGVLNLIAPKPDRKEIFRVYDPETATLWFHDHSISFGDLSTEVSRIVAVARTESRKSP